MNWVMTATLISVHFPHFCLRACFCYWQISNAGVHNLVWSDFMQPHCICSPQLPNLDLKNWNPMHSYSGCSFVLTVDLNLLSWSMASNAVALALNSSVYLWNAANGSITELCVTPSDGNDVYYSSVSFMPTASDSIIALGNSLGAVQVYWFDAKLEHRKCIGLFILSLFVMSLAATRA